jgi:hypothetical protein
MPEEQTQQAQETEKRGSNMKIIGIIILVIIIVIAALLWLLSRQPKEDVFEMPVNGAPVAIPSGGGLPGGGTSAPIAGGVIPEPEEVEEIQVDQRSSLKRLAMAFTERYGSYSNQSDFENLLDLTALMSKAMADRTESFVEGARANQDSTGYSGTTTRALSVKIDSYHEDAGDATLTVSAQRRSASDTAEDRIYYQSITIEFIKIGESWKADSAIWNEEEGAEEGIIFPGAQ